MVVEAVSVAEEAAVAVLAAVAEALAAAEALVDEVADVTLVHLHLQVDTVVLAVVETVMVVMAADLANALDHGNFHPYSSISNPSSAHHHEEPDPRQSTMHMIVINCPSAKKTSLPSPHFVSHFILRHFIVLLPLSYCAIHNESV